jgi:hypothetical protein
MIKLFSIIYKVFDFLNTFSTKRLNNCQKKLENKQIILYHIPSDSSD